MAHSISGQDLYLSALYLFDGVIGNSSSGIIEAPLIKIPTLNVGTDKEVGSDSEMFLRQEQANTLLKKVGTD